MSAKKLTYQDRSREADMRTLAAAFFRNLERGRSEYGGWGIDDKRPFGNSDVEGDVLELLEAPTACPHCGRGEDDGYTEEAREYAASLYDDLGDWLGKEWVRLRMVDDRMRGLDK